MPKSSKAQRERQKAHQLKKSQQVWADIKEAAESLKELTADVQSFGQTPHKEAYEELLKKRASYDKFVSQKDKDAVDELLAIIKKQLEAGSRDADVKTRTAAQKLQAYIDSTRGKSGAFSFRKALLQASGIMGEGSKLLNGLKNAPGRAYAKALDTALRLAGNNPTAVRIIKAVDGTNKVLKVLGVETFKWLGKKLSGLTRTLRGWLSRGLNTVNAGAGLLSKIIGGVLAGPAIWEALKGIHKALEAEYGEEYVQRFLKFAWKESQAGLDKVMDWFGIQWNELSKRVSNYLTDGYRYVLTKIDEVTSYIETSYKGLKAWISETWEKSLTTIKSWLPDWLTGKYKVEPFGKSVAPPSAESNNISTRLSVFNSMTDPVKRNSAKVAIQQAIKAVPDSSLDPTLSVELLKQGFNVPTVKVNKQYGKATDSVSAPPKTTVVKPAPSVSGGSSGDNENAVRAAPQSSSVGARMIPTHPEDDTLAIYNTRLYSFG